jgi:Ca-activated chloride channel family protein
MVIKRPAAICRKPPNPQSTSHRLHTSLATTSNATHARRGCFTQAVADGRPHQESIVFQFRLPPTRPNPLRKLGWCVAVAATAAVLLVAWGPAQADDSEAAPAEGPYFQLKHADPTLDRLPLKSTQVDARIAGVIAEVTVTQVYRNEGQRAIEARYVFPGSTQSAVHAMQIKVADRVVSAQIREKQRARIEFDQARKEGKTAALLEQDRPNVFGMNVANILPGDEVQVQMKYSELIAPTEGRYQFVYPTVVGPRYHVPRAAGGTSQFPATAHARAGEPVPGRFDLQVRFASPLPVSGLHSDTHALEITGDGSRDAAVQLTGAAPRANRDFILEYRLGGERTATGLTLWKGDDGENFFLGIVEPPQSIAPAAINPREYVFVVDISGSMHGQPLATAKTLLRHLIGSLRPSDSFNVMLFSGSSQMLADRAVPATRPNIERAIEVIDRARGGGSTEIVPALRRVAALPRPEDLSRTVVVVTDGYVTVESQVFQLIRANLHKTNVFAFGIGSSVNRHLIEGIARAGMGEPFIVTRPEHAAAQAKRLRRMIDSPVLTQVQARFEGLDVFDVQPGQLPDVLGGRPVVVYGKWRGEPKGQLVVQGHAAGGTQQDVVQVGTPDADAGALRHLWARSRIQQLADQEALEGGDAQREPITQLGLRYGLLTQYTSFIAVDQVVRTREHATPVNQALPMPEGVSNLAIGAEVPSTPEPREWLALAAVMALLGGMAAARRRAA